MNLTEHDGPGWRFVAAAASSFVEAEGLEGSSKRKEEQRRRDEDTKIEVEQTGVLQDGVGRRHGSFLHKVSKYDKFSPI